MALSKRLTGEQMEAFMNAMVAAFSRASLTQMLKFRLNRNLEEIALGDSLKNIVFDLIDTADREGWALRLLQAARSSNPANPDLVELEIAFGLSPIEAEEKTGFEKIVREHSKFIDVVAFRERLGKLEHWICAIEARGTGVLIGPDLVMTNYHVVEDLFAGKSSPGSVRCRFDFKALQGGGVLDGGQVTGLAPGQWWLEKSPYGRADHDVTVQQWQANELDFAILRLAQPIGERPIGARAEPDAAKRGWLTLSSLPASVNAGEDLFVFQHPQDLDALPETKLQPMKLTVGCVQDFVGNGLRVRHDALTLPGSSGSACFNADLDWVALHHAGEPNNRLDYKAAFNQAIPMTEIVRYLTENGHAAILDKAPPS